MKRTVLATGLQFPEGPVWLGTRRVAFTEIRSQFVSLWHDGALARVARTGGGANGATLGPDGALYVANNGGLALGHEGRWTAPDAIPGRIQRVTLAGEVSDVAVRLPGAPPNRPNDLCFGPDGLLYYTDPHNWEDLEHLGLGRVGRTTLDGRVELVAEIPAFPNGIAFGPDDRLYVAQSVTQKILVMDAKPGATPAVYATLPPGYPDGFCFDADRKSTRLNSSHGYISYAVFCLKKKQSVAPELPSAHRQRGRLSPGRRPHARDLHRALPHALSPVASEPLRVLHSGSQQLTISSP